MRNWNHFLENTLRSFTLFITVKALAKLNLGHHNNLKNNFKQLAVVVHVLQTTQNWSFHVVVLPTTAKKCTKIYNARAQPLFCSLNLLFCDVPVAVAVAVVVILNSLIILMTPPFSDSIVFFVHTRKQRFQKASLSNRSTLVSVFEWLRFR